MITRAGMCALATVALVLAGFGAPALAGKQYKTDDGLGESGVGCVSCDIWSLNHFTLVADGEVIIYFKVAWGLNPGGLPAELLLFDDPNNDGDPSDITPADLLYSQSILTGAGPTDTFTQYMMPPTLAGAAGDSFFVGLFYSESGADTLARVDTTSVEGESWFASSVLATGTPGDPAAANGSSLFVSPFGNTMIRAIGGSPLVVELTSFNAKLTDNGVVVSWTTESEQDNVGFRVLRLRPDSRQKGPEILTPQYIPSQGGELSGASYEYVDRVKGAGIVHYYLEDIDLFGTVTRHGPVVLAIPDRTRVAPELQLRVAPDAR